MDDYKKKIETEYGSILNYFNAVRSVAKSYNDQFFARLLLIPIFVLCYHFHYGIQIFIIMCWILSYWDLKTTRQRGAIIAKHRIFPESSHFNRWFASIKLINVLHEILSQEKQNSSALPNNK